MKRFHVITLGCKLNIYESESISFDLKSQGYVQSGNIDNTDIFIINTCTVTTKADSKCRYVIRKTRNSHQGALIIVCGCLVNTDIDKLLEMKEVDIFVENKNKDKIGEIISAYDGNTKPLIYKNNHDGTFNFRTHNMSNHSRAFVKIQDGCNNMCSYCKIPMARGTGRSRDVKSIHSEINEIMNNGYNEVVLTGVNIGSFSDSEMDFSKLLLSLSKAFPEMRFRISSLEPQYIDRAFLDVFTLDNICPHLHVPLQSGSDKILKSMNRNYSTSDFIEKIIELRNVKHEPFISTDLILGFPGEQDLDFNDTLGFIEKINFAYIHIFGFSPREGTKAFFMLPKIPERLRDERIDIVEKLVEKTNLDYRKMFIGKTLEVIIETKKAGYYKGKSENYLDVHIKTEENIESKKKYKTEILSVENNTNWGRVVDLVAKK